MKIIIQRVQYAKVTVDGKTIDEIDQGLLLFVGFGQQDTFSCLQKYVDKIIKLRIFEDEFGKTNLSILDVKGSLLVVSQFTLYANCQKGNRPSFTSALNPTEANYLYESFIQLCKEQLSHVAHGKFGADMKVELLNDGPFTIVLDETL